ncbi:MAG: hypothetical protein R2911_28585 [Caldilineaceae bacterium]
MTAEPQQVRFDPHMKVLRKLEFNPGSTMLRRQLTRPGHYRPHSGRPERDQKRPPR